VWCGVVWCGVVWRGVVWCSVAWRGGAWRMSDGVNNSPTTDVWGRRRNSTGPKSKPAGLEVGLKPFAVLIDSDGTSDVPPQNSGMHSYQITMRPACLTCRLALWLAAAAAGCSSAGVDGPEPPAVAVFAIGDGSSLPPTADVISPSPPLLLVSPVCPGKLDSGCSCQAGWKVRAARSRPNGDTPCTNH
jgi:hypothetical protein